MQFSGRQPCLTHPPGFGVVDTGCGRGLIGADTLQRHRDLLATKNIKIIDLANQKQVFRYGNGSVDEAIGRVEIPIFIQGRQLRMRVSVVPGQVPLLISKRCLKALGAHIDLVTSTMHLTKAGLQAPLHEPKNGSYQINLCDFDPQRAAPFKSEEIDLTDITFVNMVTTDDTHKNDAEVVMDTNEDMFEGELGSHEGSTAQDADARHSGSSTSTWRRPTTQDHGNLLPWTFCRTSSGHGVPERWHSGSLKWMGLESG